MVRCRSCAWQQQDQKITPDSERHGWRATLIRFSAGAAVVQECSETTGPKERAGLKFRPSRKKKLGPDLTASGPWVRPIRADAALEFLRKIPYKQIIKLWSS
jgi:hypothetical protein